MGTVISDLSTKNMILKEKLKTYEELIRALQKNSCLLKDQLFHFTKSFYLGHQPPHSDPTPSSLTS